MIPVEYMTLSKSTKTTKKYGSPYLEPLPEPQHPWVKVKKVKFHNMKVRRQRMRNKMEALKLQQQRDNEVNNTYYLTGRLHIGIKIV